MCTRWSGPENTPSGVCRRISGAPSSTVNRTAIEPSEVVVRTSRVPGTRVVSASPSRPRNSRNAPGSSVPSADSRIG